MQIKLLIVEDEALTRESLERVVSGSRLKDCFDEILTAADGEEGLRMARWQRPDIVLTDVRMPRLRGDLMALEIRKELPDTCIIFMSGYSDKEYLLSAVKVNAADYIEKPLDISELLQALEKAAVRSRRRMQESRDTSINQRRLNLSLPALRHLLAQQLTAEPADAQLRREQLWSVSPEFLEPGWFLTLEIRLVSPAGEDTAGEAESLGQLLESMIGRFAAALVGRLDSGRLVAQVLCGHGEREKLAAEAVRWCCWVRDTLGQRYSFQMFVGEMVDSAEKLYLSHRSLAPLLERAFFARPGSVQFAWTKAQREQEPGETLEGLVEEILAPLRQYDKNGVENGVYRLERFLRGGWNAAEEETRAAYETLAAQIGAESERIGANAEPGLAAAARTAPCLLYLQGAFNAALNRLFSQWPDRGDVPVLALRLDKYLQENYASSQLSLHELALRFKASESYLCVMYRKTYGTTINRRITALRMQRAQRLLRESDALIKEIARSVGYADCNSFIRLFKRQTGMTPQEYREKGAP